MLAVFEVAGFYLADVYQGFEAKVDFAEAYVKFAGKLALANLRIGIDEFHDFVAVFVGEHAVDSTRVLTMACWLGVFGVAWRGE